jgi:hypothetical protein
VKAIFLILTAPRRPRFLVERIMSLNVFGCPESSLATHKDVIANKPGEDKAYHSCGIWTQASYINHSCTSNARRSFIGDMMIVRATRDIESDTEITFWYHIPTGHSVKKMQERLLSSWQFTCSCAICQDEEQTRTTTLAERRMLMEKLKRSCQVANSRNVPIVEVERLLKALDKTYSRPADQVPRLLLWDPQLLLTRLYTAQGSMKEAWASVQQVFIQLGFVIAGADSPSADFKILKWGLVVDHLVEAFLHARNAYQAMKEWGNAKKAEEYARTTYRVVVGEDVSFESTYNKQKN